MLELYLSADRSPLLLVYLKIKFLFIDIFLFIAGHSSLVGKHLDFLARNPRLLAGLYMRVFLNQVQIKFNDYFSFHYLTYLTVVALLLSIEDPKRVGIRRDKLYGDLETIICCHSTAHLNIYTADKYIIHVVKLYHS